MSAPTCLLDEHTPQPIPPVDDDDDDDDERKPGSGGGNIDPDDDEDMDDEDEDEDDEEDTLWTPQTLLGRTSSAFIRQQRIQRQRDVLKSSVAAICELVSRLPAASSTLGNRIIGF